MTSEVQLLTLLQDYISLNQSFLVEYLFTCNLKHEELKLELEKNSSKIILEIKIRELENYLTQSFSTIAEKTFLYLRRYFSQGFYSRSAIPPSINIQVIAHDEIALLVQFPKSEFRNIEHTIYEDSAFEFLTFEHDRKYYLCNSIPESIQSGQYKNNRIDIEKASIYINKITRAESTIDLEWAKCWKKVTSKNTGEEHVPPPETCCKSTLVLPISLRSEDISSSKFKDFFNLNVDNYCNDGPIILGYLCLEHPVENYFLEDIDVKIIDIFSKFLSFYMLTEYSYTQYSPIYFKAIESIGKSSEM